MGQEFNSPNVIFYSFHPSSISISLSDLTKSHLTSYLTVNPSIWNNTTIPISSLPLFFSFPLSFSGLTESNLTSNFMIYATPPFSPSHPPLSSSHILTVSLSFNHSTAFFPSSILHQLDWSKERTCTPFCPIVVFLPQLSLLSRSDVILIVCSSPALLRCQETE